MEEERELEQIRIENLERRVLRRRWISVIMVIAVVFLSAGLIYTWHMGRQDRVATLVFAYQDRGADAASIIAIEMGFFEMEGVRVEGKRFTSGPESTQALISGAVDVGTMGDTTAIVTVANQGENFHIIASHGSGEHRHRIIVRKDSPIQEISHLEGKRIAVRKGTSTHGGLLRFSEKFGLDLSDEIMDMSPSLQLTALESGEVDAIVASEPTPSIAEYRGYGRELATLGGLDNTYPILLVVNVSYGQRNPDRVVAFLRGMERAVNFIQENPQDSARILANVSGLPVEVVERNMEFHDIKLVMDRQTVESLHAMARFLAMEGSISKQPDLDTVVDTRFLEELGK